MSIKPVPDDDEISLQYEPIDRSVTIDKSMSMRSKTSSEDEGICLSIPEEQENVGQKIARIAKEVGSKLFRGSVKNQKGAKAARRSSTFYAVVTEERTAEYDQQLQLQAGDPDELGTLAPGRGSEMEKLELPRRRASRQNAVLEKDEEMERSSESLEEKIERLVTRNECLKDEIVAARQTMVDTQLRQLSELQSLTKETRELKQTLSELHLQQQQSAADKRHQGKLPTASFHAGG